MIWMFFLITAICVVRVAVLAEPDPAMNALTMFLLICDTSLASLSP